MPHREVHRRRARDLRRRVPDHARASSPTSSASCCCCPPTRALVSGGSCPAARLGRPRCRGRAGAAAAGAARLRRRGHGHRVRRPPSRGGSSGERRRALAVAFFDPARELHGTRAVRRDAAVRGPQAQPHARRARRSSATATAGRRSCAGPLDARASSRVADGGRPGRHGRAPCARSRGEVGGHDAWSASAPSPRPRRRPRGTSSTRCARSPRCSTASTRSLALARRPRGARGHGEELRHGRAARARASCSRRGRAHLDGLRRRRPPAQRRARAVAARARTSRGARRARSRRARRSTLEGLRVHAAVFRWRMEGRDGAGRLRADACATSRAGGRVIRAVDLATSAAC